ncbi:MAG: hydrolase [Betaproteobacteria bacterium]
MLIDSKNSGLLVIDVQEKLLPAIHDAQRVLESCLWLVNVARRLRVPIAATEQYPRGLGVTVAALREALGDSPIVEKITFSGASEPAVLATPAVTRQQVIVAGTETHVCVLQTVVGLLALNKDVFIVADAVGSRSPQDRELALARLRHLGVTVVTREMVAFEWLERAGTGTFREISRDFLRGTGRQPD